jgi:hypothetical protein
VIAWLSLIISGFDQFKKKNNSFSHCIFGRLKNQLKTKTMKESAIFVAKVALGAMIALAIHQTVIAPMLVAKKKA